MKLTDEGQAIVAQARIGMQALLLAQDLHGRAAAGSVNLIALILRTPGFRSRQWRVSTAGRESRGRLRMTEDENADAQGMVTNVPSSAGWLGGLGAVPFIGLAAATPFLSGPTKMLVAHAMAAYGAVILSFLGGVHWGLAIGSERSSDRRKLPSRLILSVVPSLVGWCALLMRETTGLFILAAAVAMMLWVDLRATTLGEAPPWYPKLRIPLSLVVIAALLIDAMRTATELPSES